MILQVTAEISFVARIRLTTLCERSQSGLSELAAVHTEAERERERQRKEPARRLHSVTYLLNTFSNILHNSRFFYGNAIYRVTS